MPYFRCGSGAGSDLFEDLVNTCPVGMLPLSGAGSGANVSWETSVSLGSGHKKMIALLAYYGPGAVSGATLNGSITFSINNTPLTIIKKSTVRNEDMAKAIEYWEADIDPEINITSIAYAASNYNFNSGTKIVVTYWII